MHIKYFLINFLILLLFSNICIAQAKNDSLKTISKDSTIKKLSVNTDSIKKNTIKLSDTIESETLADSIVTKPQPFQPDPKKAGLYSAILPGLGQIYNRQFWKVPVIYAGLTIAGYLFLDDYNNYQTFRKAYIGRINNPYPTDKFVNIYTQSQLQQLQADYNKYLDMTILYSVIGFGAQVIDAIASAHLKNFDMSRDISINVHPTISPKIIGIGIVMNIK